MATNQQQPLDEFEFLRRRAQQASQTQQKQAGQDLKRQFASMGNLQSGAAIKQQQLAKMRGEQALGNELGQIDVAQAQERRRIAEQQQAMDFQSQEAQKQRQFLTGERLGSQQFGTQERIGSQGFQTGILGQQQQFQGEQAEKAQQAASFEGQANRDSMMALKNVDVNMFNKQMEQAKQQFDQNFGLKKIEVESSIANAASAIGLQQQQLDNALSLGLQQIGLDQQRINDAKELGISSIGLQKEQMDNALELGLKQIGVSQDQISLAKDQFNQELAINKMVTGLNAFTTIQELDLDSNQQRALTEDVYSRLGMTDLDLDTILPLIQSYATSPNLTGQQEIHMR